MKHLYTKIEEVNDIRGTYVTAEGTASHIEYLYEPIYHCMTIDVPWAEVYEINLAQNETFIDYIEYMETRFRHEHAVPMMATEEEL